MKLRPTFGREGSFGREVMFDFSLGRGQYSANFIGFLE